MEFVMLAFLAILIGKYIKRRYAGVSVVHAMFFVILLYLSLFTTDIPFIANAVKGVFGMEEYNFFRETMCEPCVWIYSTNFAIFLTELLLFLLVQVGTVVEVVKYLERTGAKNYRRKTKPQFDWESVPDRITFAEEKLYLDKCSLLI